MSETAVCRDRLAPFCTGLGLDIGAGGDRICPLALTFDMPTPYTKVANVPQILRGDCRDLGMFCDSVLDFIYSSHLLEDFTYHELIPIITEWRRVLKPGGKLVIYCPDQPIYAAHCAATGQPYNEAHKEPDFTLLTFFDRVITPTGPWKIIHQKALVDTYSWEAVFEKVF